MVLEKFSSFIDSLNNELNKKKRNGEDMNKKYKSIQTDITQFSEFRDEISNLLGLNQKILENLFNFEKTDEPPKNNGIKEENS